VRGFQLGEVGQWRLAGVVCRLLVLWAIHGRLEKKVGKRFEYFRVYCIFLVFMSCSLIIGCCKTRVLQPIFIEGIL
jgi:hypothetical protein